MTVSRERGLIYFECDAGCPEVCETHTKDFDEAREILREAGWTTIHKGGGVWLHFCPDEEMDTR